MAVDGHLALMAETIEEYLARRRAETWAQQSALMEQMEGLLAPPPPPDPDSVGSYATDVVKGVGKGFSAGLYDPQVTHPTAALIGELVGSIAPFGAALKGAGLALRGVKSLGPLARVLAQEGLAGAAMGGLYDLDEDVGLDERTQRAITGGLATPMLGMVGRAIPMLPEFFRAGPSGTKPPVLGLPSPEAFPLSPEAKAEQLRRVAELQERLAGGPKPLVTPVQEGQVPPAPRLGLPGPAGPAPLLLEQKPPVDFEVTPGGVAAPAGPAASMAALLERTRPSSTEPARPALPAPPDFFTTPGGQVVPRGTVGRQLAETDAMIERQVGRPPSTAPLTDADLIHVGEVKGFDLTKQSDGTWRAIGPGGRDVNLSNTAELRGFLLSQPVRPIQPVELKTPPGKPTVAQLLEGPAVEQVAPESTFVKAVQGKPLTPADKANLQAQAQFWEGQPDRILAQVDPAVTPTVQVAPKPGTVGELFAPAEVKPTISERPLIGRKATPEEAPLFSKQAQTPEPAQTELGSVGSTPGPGAMKKATIERAIQKILQDKGADQGPVVERVYEAIRADPEFQRSPWAKDLQEITKQDILESLQAWDAPPAAAAMPKTPPPAAKPGKPTPKTVSLADFLTQQGMRIEPKTDPLKGPWYQVFDAKGQLRAQGDAEQLTSAIGTLAEEQGVKLGPLPSMGGGAPGRGEPQALFHPLGERARFVNPLAQPALAGGTEFVPGVTFANLLGEETSRAELAMKAEASEWGAYLRDQLIAHVGDDAALRTKAFRYVQGDLTAAEAGPRAVQAGEAYRTAMRDFARRLGLPQWDYYATHLTDFDALYQTFRDTLLRVQTLGDVGRLGGSASAWLQANIGSEAALSRLKAALASASSWEQAPRALRHEMKSLWGFGGAAEKWESLPQFVRDRLPEEVFSPYLLKRQGGVPYKEDLVEAFQRYVPVTLKKIHMDPILARWRPFIEQLPGEILPYTEKGYLHHYLERVVAGRPTWDEKTLQLLYDTVTRTLGKELFTLAGTHAAVSGLRGAAYRGLIGVDSAIINLTQSLNTWAETGRLWSPMFKFVKNLPQEWKRQGLFGEYAQVTRDLEAAQGAGSSTTQKLLALDELASKIVLSPMSMTEFVNRGIAFEAGVEQGIARGLTYNETLVNSFAAASRVVPNLQIPEAWGEALFRTIPKTQFGMGLSAQRSPYFRGPLGRLSSILTTYPTQQTQFLFKGVTDALRTSDHGKLLRFTAMLGFYATLPVLAAETFGIDIRKQFGAESLWGQLTLPIYRQLGNAYRAVMGENPLTRRQAQEGFTEFMKQLAVPQFRYLEKAGVAQALGLSDKVGNVLDNIERGYATDAHGRFLYETTPMGEVLKLMGVNPEAAHDTRAVTKAIVDQALEYRLDRQAAIDRLLTQQDASAAQEFTQKWGRPLTMSDLLKAQQERMKPPQERALGMVPKGLRPRVLSAAQEEAGGF